MKCPIDGSVLQMSNRENIEIDYCPECRGVWLDRGELDKIVEKSMSSSQQSHVRPQPREYEPEERHHYKDSNNDYSHHKRKKKSSFLEDIFDF